MATDKQGSTREQGRQQSADMGPGATRTQQGSTEGQSSTAREYGGQRTGQYRGTLQTRGGMQPAAWSNYGGYGSGPFSVMRRISDEMDRLFEGFGFGRSGFGGETAWPAVPSSGTEQGASLWSPHLEMYERDGKLTLTADLPGVRKEDVKVEIDENAITIQGQRRQEQASQERGYYRSERSYGSFYRTIPLPEGANPSTANATFRDGVLQITLQAPQKQTNSRTLEIKDGPALEGRSGTGESPSSGGQQR